MGEEEGAEPPTLSVHESFPDIEEADLQSLSPWPSGEKVIQGFYTDLYGLAPPPCADPLIKRMAELRVVLAHVATLKYSSADSRSAQIARRFFDNSMLKFVALHAGYSATVIQRWWRARSPAATAADRQRMARALRGSPAAASSADECEVRRELIQAILAVGASALP
jgi:hypothetical protein